MNVLKNRVPAGFSLIEVMVAVLVLSTGLLALAALQATLTRNSADAKSRSQVVAYVDSSMEALRSRPFNQIGSSQLTAWLTDSSRKTALQNAAGVTLGTPVATVTHYVAPSGSTSFSPWTGSTAPSEALPQYKQVRISIPYTDSMGQTRTFAQTDIVSPLSIRADSTLVDTPPSGSTQPSPTVIQATPSQPGLIPIAVGDNQNTAATNPKPVLVAGESVLATRFDVLTYQNENSSDARVQRKVDTLMVQCTCQFGSAPSSVNEVLKTRFRPTFWTGNQYSSPKTTTEAGVAPVQTWEVPSTSRPNQDPAQSPYCLDCCRDHQDGTGAVEKFSPTMSSHGHFRRDNTGTLQLVSSGQYEEACRLIRVDGVYHVASDMNMLHMNLLETKDDARSYLPSSTGTSNYQHFVLSYLSDQTSPLSTINSSQVDGAALETVNSLNRPALLSMLRTATEKRYLHNRGLYLDYIEEDALTFLTEKLAACGDVDCLLPYIPFVSINTTEISRWSTSSSTLIVDNSSGYVGQTADEPARGRLTPGAGAADGQRINTAVTMHESNPGLVASVAINANRTGQKADQQAVLYGTAVDTDSDGLSDATEADLGTDPNNPDTDGDGLRDGAEVNPTAPTPATDPLRADTDGDGVNDGTELTNGTDPTRVDTDGDGVNDGTDNCPLNPNPDQLDSDGDGMGDVCDMPGDRDNDGVRDNDDNCPEVANPDQNDTDLDGIGDACDPAGSVSFTVTVTGIGTVSASAPPTVDWIVGSGNTRACTPVNAPSGTSVAYWTCQAFPTYGNDIRLVVGKYSGKDASTPAPISVTNSAVCPNITGNKTSSQKYCQSFALGTVALDNQIVVPNPFGAPANDRTQGETTTISIPQLSATLPHAVTVSFVQQGAVQAGDVLGAYLSTPVCPTSGNGVSFVCP